MTRGSLRSSLLRLIPCLPRGLGHRLKVPLDRNGSVHFDAFGPFGFDLVDYGAQVWDILGLAGSHKQRTLDDAR